MNENAKAIYSTVTLSVLAGGFAFVVFVLPAEYGLDPTGLGDAMGINGMSGIHVSALSHTQRSHGEDEGRFSLMPFESIEYKYELPVGAGLVYAWSAESEVLYDLHSEEKGGDPQDAISFAVGRAPADQGVFVAPFAGRHGWFWENRGDNQVTVVLRTAGHYEASITYSQAGEFRREMD